MSGARLQLTIRDIWNRVSFAWKPRQNEIQKLGTEDTASAWHISEVL
jgi:hypothetical protein